MINRVMYLCRRLRAMGLKVAINLLFLRIKKKLFILQWRYKKAPVFTGLTQRINPPLTVTILGFGSHTFASIDAINWHADFFIPVTPAGWGSAFFADITIPHNANLKLTDPRQADIKVPWELSRLHCLYGASTEIFVSTLAHWMMHNPFPYGINWMNPMEVAIRAVNITTCLQVHSPHLTAQERKAIHTLLGYHALFIENCWEASDKPNNHYLADLLGYLVLCCNVDIKKYYRNKLAAWQWFLDGLKTQLLPDGTQYEGSTAYHRLVTEMVDIALACAQKHNLPIPPALLTTQQQMHQFLADCTDADGNVVLIGDNDSGSILPPQPAPTPGPIKESTVKHYPHFGISILQTPRLHATLRHATYQPHQPSGHFHQDALAITLSINGIPVISDPGTYVYTAHPAWRNQLRSAAAHSLFMPQSLVQSTITGDLFQLERPTVKPYNPQSMDMRLIGHYECHGVSISRTIRPHGNSITIEDCANGQTQTPMRWQLYLGDHISVKNSSDHEWQLFYKGKAIANLKSSIALGLTASTSSRSYGTPCDAITLYNKEIVLLNKGLLLIFTQIEIF